jgi:hypothetical protein
LPVATSRLAKMGLPRLMAARKLPPGAKSEASVAGEGLVMVRRFPEKKELQKSLKKT